MTEAAERARVKTHYSNYFIARANFWEHEDNRAIEEQYLAASDQWRKVERYTELSRREVREIIQEVVAELNEVG